MMILELLGMQWIQRMENSGKKAMVEEMATLDKNEAWDLVESLTRRNLICNK
jgi:hypothetical protein